MFHPHQLSYKTPSCEKSTQTLFTTTSRSWSKLLDMNILLKNIIYANMLYVACCLHNIPSFCSRVICMIWTHRLTSYSKLIFTYNTRNAGSKSHLRFCFKLFSLFLQNTYNSIHFNSGKNLTSLWKLQIPFWTAVFCSGNKSGKFLFPPFVKKNYTHIHTKKS